MIKFGGTKIGDTRQTGHPKINHLTTRARQKIFTRPNAYR